jgi:hypothetical protein
LKLESNHEKSGDWLPLVIVMVEVEDLPSARILAQERAHEGHCAYRRIIVAADGQLFAFTTQ